MSITNVQSNTSTTAAAATTAASSPAVNQQTFLKLLMAQLQNQDPLQPTDSTQFVTQLSQFSLVEQSVSQTASLSTISSQLGGLSSNEAANLIGKTVTVNSASSVTFNGVTAVGENVSLASAAANVTAVVTDGSGNAVRTINLGSHGTGALPISWDGKNDNGQLEPAGTYNITLKATATDGTPVNVSQYTTGVVQSVDYSQGYANLILSNGVSTSIANLVNVSATPTK